MYHLCPFLNSLVAEVVAYFLLKYSRSLKLLLLCILLYSFLSVKYKPCLISIKSNHLKCLTIRGRSLESVLISAVSCRNEVGLWKVYSYLRCPAEMCRSRVPGLKEGVTPAILTATQIQLPDLKLRYFEILILLYLSLCNLLCYYYIILCLFCKLTK